jgi:hypothetical protein
MQFPGIARRAVAACAIIAALAPSAASAATPQQAAGIDAQRVSASANLVALLATAYNRTGDLEGSFAGGATNLAAFSTLALARVGAPGAVLAKANAYSAASSTATAAGTSVASPPTPSARRPGAPT